uniref:MFS domain-containing protein n=1 Tax=Caenorhabditis japonica TaxID=281687 RepID=A0A8R1DM24_CAEJA
MRLWGNYFRVVIVLISFLCLVSVCSNYIIINFTFICMKDDMEGAVDVNGTLKSIYDYTPTEKKYILWAVAFGTMVGTFPINVLYVQYGAKLPFFFAGVLSAVTTGLTPWAAASGSMWIFIALRFLQICDSSLGWKWSFYLHAAACLVVFGVWVLVYKDDPQLHKSVSGKELGRIQKNKSEAHIGHRDGKGKSKLVVPYRSIFLSPVVITVWLCAFTELSTLILIATYAPIYFRSVLGFDANILSFVFFTDKPAVWTESPDVGGVKYSKNSEKDGRRDEERGGDVKI